MSDDALKKYQVRHKRKVDLSGWDTDEAVFFDTDKEGSSKLLKKLHRQLADLQELLYAQHKHRLLVILQAMDTGGKDSTIRHVFEGVNPQGVRVAVFKEPTQQELDHDYLWRVHARMPAKGEIVIFNRSHYEDVLIVRVHELVPQAVWQKRFEQINCFEKMLAEEGTTILKFFLHISRGEQKKRLEKRFEDPRKYWKFAPSDLKERRYWPQYVKAYEDVLSRTSTAWAPWYIIPADHKWYRNLAVTSIIVHTLKSLKMKYPRFKEG